MQKNAAVLLKEFIEGVSVAAGASGQMIHSHQDPRFMFIRDKLELIKDRCVKIASNAASTINMPIKK
jgi:hypothetical protein